VTDNKNTFSAVLVLPAHEQLPVLAIDDNVDTLRMLQRYTSGTRYHLVGTQDPEESLNLVEQISPQIIVLDVMMPQVDGWRVLGRLRQHPLTERVPVVVCSILAQEELAFSLGASGFVRKPVTRRAFLAALDQQMNLREPERR
jgi:CheY-like chemotaxis protein